MIDLDSKYLLVVTDDILEDSDQALAAIGEPDNSFRKMIDVSAEYRAANLTPIVVYDFKTQTMLCIVKELYGKKLH